MKTSILRTGLLLTLILIVNSACTPHLKAQPTFGKTDAPALFDHVINARGESRVSLLTGLPVVGSLEYAYGISDRLTGGVFVGSTPFEEAIGVRVRTVLYDNSHTFRVYFCTPVVFYPQMGRQNPDAWYLTRPNINFEWVRKSNFRYKVGGSLIGSSSHKGLFGDASQTKHDPEMWTAIHAGFSLPVGSDISFQTELSYVMKGLKTVDTFFGGPPSILITGFSYTF